MDANMVINNLFPCWMLGIAMLYLVRNSRYAYLLRIDKEGLWKFAKFMMVLLVARTIYLEFIAPDFILDGMRNITHSMPWPALFGVFWEDACNALALVLMRKMFWNKPCFQKLRLPILGLMALSFGLGHSYEGIGAIFAMTCYVPITMNLSKRYGFGTIMLCHVIYDLLTYLSFRLILG